MVLICVCDLCALCSYGKTLEEDVLQGLTPVVTSIAVLMLLTSVALYSNSKRTSSAVR